MAAWGIKWRSVNKLDGDRSGLRGRHQYDVPDPHPCLAGYSTMVFSTKKEARAFIKEHWGYLAKRSDLKREPHCWRMPWPVRVEVSVKEVIPVPTGTDGEKAQGSSE